MGDDVALEGYVFSTLGDGLRVGHAEPSLNTRQSAEPGKLHLVVGEGCDGRGVAFDREIFDRDAELALEILGVLRKSFDQACLVLIGNGGEDKRVLLRLRCSRREQGDCNSGKYGAFEHSNSLFLPASARRG